MSYKPLFSRFLSSCRAPLHFAAHSHHFWPDAALEGHARAAEDACRLADEKWEVVFGEVLPAARAHVARLLRLPGPERVTFGGSTHEFVVRILSCLPQERPLRILTTDAEYHSFRRQVDRLAEAGRAEVERVSAEPFESFAERFAGAAARGGHDLVYLSHVFFDSGYVIPDLAGLVAAVPEERSFVVIDGYHSFMALPVDLSPIAERAFYTAGGYKYAMSGEGACFLVCPPGYGPRPLFTGWMASFDAIAAPRGGGVSYPEDAHRFFGATFDPTGLYRFVATMDALAAAGVDPPAIHEYVRRLQTRFLERVDDTGHRVIRTAALLPPPHLEERGHFLTFRSPEAGAVRRALREKGVLTDHRGDRLRLGFGLYHDEQDVDRLLDVIASLA